MDIFTQISIILVLVLVISIIAKLLKQPLIIGYILTGILLGGAVLNVINESETITLFSHIGVAFLLFIVGLNLNPKVIKQFGMQSIIAGILQIVIMTLLGFVISKLFGYNIITSLYIGLAIAFSSTIIVLKIFSDKRELETLHSKMSIGVLLTQDLVAIAVLMTMTSLNNTTNLVGGLIKIAGISITAITLVILTAIYIIPKTSNFFAKSQEFLLIFSIGWGLGLAALFQHIGLSIEIGALIAGISLAITPYHYEISAKLRTLRDFFVVIFFVSLGTQIKIEVLTNNILQIITLSLIILIGTPIIMTAIVGFLGYKKRTGFLTGLAISQVSEFSLIMLALAASLGQISKDIVTIITIVAIITILISTYYMMFEDKIYNKFKNKLKFFERKKLRKDVNKTERYELLLFGYNRVGYDFLRRFEKLDKKFIIIDYNPEVIETLEQKGVPCLYGDADDEEFLEEIDMKKTKLIVSTIPKQSSNLLLLNRIRKHNKTAIALIIAHNIKDAYELYKNGATYVMMPHFLGGAFCSALIKKHGLNPKKFMIEQKKHIMHLKNRKELGHEYPEV